MKNDISTVLKSNLQEDFSLQKDQNWLKIKWHF